VKRAIALAFLVALVGVTPRLADAAGCPAGYLIGGLFYCSPTPAPTPTPGATIAPDFIDTTPGPFGSYPIAVTIPNSASGTFVVGFDCNANVNGNQLIAAIGSVSVDGGNFAGSSSANPPTSQGGHNFSSASGLQASLAQALNAGAPPGAGQSYVAIATHGATNGTALAWAPITGGVVGSLTSVSVTDPTPLASATAWCIGGTGTACATRVAQCDEWGIKHFAAEITDTTNPTRAQVAAGVGPNPYPTLTPAPTPTPTPVSTASPWDPPTATPLVYSYPGIALPGSPFLTAIGTPTVNASSAAWVTAMLNGAGNSFQIGQIQISMCSAPTSNACYNNDVGFPVYFDCTGTTDSQCEQVQIHCTHNYSSPPCPAVPEGATIGLDPRWQIETGDQTNHDSHIVVVSPQQSKIYVLWQVGAAAFQGSGSIGCMQTFGGATGPTFCAWPPSGGVLNVSWGGSCDSNHNGFQDAKGNAYPHFGGCNGDATSTPMELGVLRPTDLMNAVNAVHAGNANATLSNAVAFALPCFQNLIVAPFVATDGTCTGLPPEGTNMYLAVHDAAINALGLPIIPSIILRTMDEDHYGAYGTDTGGGSSNGTFQIQILMGGTYTTWGAANPWVTQIEPELAAEGYNTSACTPGAHCNINLPIPSSLTGSLRFSAVNP
jgi:hypothetical protein